MKKVLVLSGLLALISAPAHALTLSANGGAAFLGGDAYPSAFVESPAINLGGEITFGLDMAQLGGFFDHTMTKGKAGNVDGSINSYGAVGRVSPPGTDLFGDLKLGFAKPSETGFDSSFMFGVGVGYKIALAPFVSLSPRVAYRNVPAKVTGATSSLSGSIIDAGVLLSFGI